MNKLTNKLALFTMLCLLLVSAGCNGNSGGATAGGGSDTAGETLFTYGTTAYGTAMQNAGLDPHNTYMGWSTLRYGVGETLFRFSESMELEPWLATGYEQVDECTVRIDLRDDVTFSSGRKMTGEAVKECLDNLIAVHDRAPADLNIAEITADGQSVTVTSSIKTPALLGYLSDPYGAIIDMQAGVDDTHNVAGTGPFVARSVTPTEINLEANERYWGGTPKVDRVRVMSITDGDTLTMAMQAGEIDAAQGLPYASLTLFRDNPTYKISSADTSRVYQAAYNLGTDALQDLNVRRAIAMAIDKEGFTSVLLDGNGSPAAGPFPGNFPFGGGAVTAPAYNPDGARALLAEAGWTDSDGDGYVDRDGAPLTIRWLTYTSRQELPLLAEAAQASLKDIGIRVEVNATDNYNAFLERGEFDLYAKAFVAAPTGDPQYYFTTHLLETSAYNNGGYHSDAVEALVEELRGEFDAGRRGQLAIAIQQQVLDDCAFLYASHLRMSFVMRAGVTGFAAHPSDYYEITADLDIEV